MQSNKKSRYILYMNILYFTICKCYYTIKYLVIRIFRLFFYL